MAGYRSQLDVTIKARGESRLQAQRQRLRSAGLLPLGAESGGASSDSTGGQALQIRLRGSFACRSNRLLLSAGCWAVGPGCLPNNLPDSNGRGLGGWQGLA